MLYISMGFDKCLMSYIRHYGIIQNSFADLNCSVLHLFISLSSLSHKLRIHKKCHLFCKMSQIPSIIIFLMLA